MEKFATRKTSEFEKSVLDYLNDLRETGTTNMYGAAKLSYIIIN